MKTNSKRISRYPASTNRSLKPWSAADDYLLQMASDMEDGSTIAIYNDRFGFLSTHLFDTNPILIGQYKSQQDSILQNLKDNNYSTGTLQFQSPIESTERSIQVALVKVPKSMDLFRLFIDHIYKNSDPSVTIFCGFMTKYFTKQMLDICTQYYEKVTQSLAVKKSRVITLSQPKQGVSSTIINTIPFQIGDRTEVIRQYYGVFSGKHIDYATQFLLDNVEIDSSIHKVLDLACGNGIIAYDLLDRNPSLDIEVMDDSILAIESAKLNLGENCNYYHYENTLDHMERDQFDMVICNPPFHFEHENTIEIALDLFQGAKKVLKEDGRFVCVANIHLNYKTHLSKIFDSVVVLAMNDKYIVYDCYSDEYI